MENIDPMAGPLPGEEDEQGSYYQPNKEFDPTKEKHLFGFVVKSVDPGCTLEMQIEDNEGGVYRFTSTDDRAADFEEFSRMVNEAFRRWFDRTF